jgi:hypothetical protein
MYNKLFTKILDSSIWLESAPTRLVWLTMIAAMDETGFALFASIPNLAHRARVTPEEAEAAVKCLESPDQNSSDPENEGRRIERVPGGWMILNAPKYRDLVTKAVIREQTRARVQRFREEKRNACNAGVTPKKRRVTPSEARAIAEAKVPPPPGAGELGLSDSPNGLRPNHEQKRLNAIFCRRDTTKWNPSETKALRAISPIPEEDLAAVERYYSARIPKDEDYRRHDLPTLLNNWNGEVDRARKFKPTTCF